MKNQKPFLASCILVILFVFLLASSYISADSISNRKLILGPVISGLRGTDISTSKFAEAYIPRGGERTETLHFSLDTDKASLHKMAGRDYVKIEDLKPYGGKPGEPQLPFKPFVVTLPLNSEVSGVTVSNISYRPILNKLNIAPVPKPVKWTPGGEKLTSGNVECKTYSSESFFPGNLVSYNTGKDNNNRYVFVKFFPMQYIPKTKQALLITYADITVNYQLTGVH